MIPAREDVPVMVEFAGAVDHLLSVEGRGPRGSRRDRDGGGETLTITAELPAPNDGGAEDSAVPQTVLGVAEPPPQIPRRLGQPRISLDLWQGRDNFREPLDARHCAMHSRPLEVPRDGLRGRQVGTRGQR
jgi:hypothetical protein